MKETLFPEIQEADIPSETCRKCKYRMSAPLNQYSPKRIQSCIKQKERNNYGYKTVKVTDRACRYFEEEK